ncbi:MAG: metal ABC transporter permease, partial [Lacticaseibacillus paracasei]|nr:metal ABC transporter permease [Lacticaseibacillus paracasei]
SPKQAFFSFSKKRREKKTAAATHTAEEAVR